jgi:phenylacetate-CoA ligase
MPREGRACEVDGGVRAGGDGMDLYGELFRAVLFPAWEGSVRRRPTAERLAWLEATQWKSRDELEAMQLDALRRLVAHAREHVPFYRERLDGIDEASLRSLDDLAKIPILSHDEARVDPERRESRAEPRPTIRKQTSGTTGQPLVIGYEPSSECWRQAVKLRAYAWAGYDVGDRVLFFWGAPVAGPVPIGKRAKVLLDRAMKRERHFPCALLDDAHLAEVARSIARDAPDVVVTYAHAGAELARFVLRTGARSWSTIPLVCGAERLLPRDRADLEAAFGPVFDTYGCREVMLIGAECEAHDGLHVSMENLVVEIVVTEPDGSRRTAREGELGEVVLTDLHNFAMPFLRYANGDVAVAGPRARCACGRGLARIRDVAGRTSELLRDALGRPVTGLSMSFLFANLGMAVRQFQLVQHRDRSVTLKLALDAPLEPSVIERLREDCAARLSGLPVRIEPVRTLPRSPAGKHRLVVVEPS